MSTVVEPTWSPGFQSFSSRVWILASFYTAIVLAIPFWLKATTIERLPLPRHDVVAWEARLPCPIRHHQSISLHLPEDVVKPADRYAVADRIQWALRVAGDGIWEQRKPRKHYVDDETGNEGNGTEVVEEAATPLQYAACVDWDVRLADREDSRSVTGLHYEIDFSEGSEASATMQSTATSRRMQIPLPAQLTSAPNIESEETAYILSSYLARLLQLPYTPLLSPFQESSTIEKSPSTSSVLLAEIEKKEEDRRRVPYTRNLRLVFSLINEEISAASEGTTHDRKQTSGVLGWDRREVDDLFLRRFTPLLDALSGTQTIQTELQTTWFAPLQFQPKLLEIERPIKEVERTPELAAPVELVDEAEQRDTEEVESLKELEVVQDIQPATQFDQYHLIDWEDIKVFVNSGEWSLTSGAVTLPLTSVNASSENQGKQQEVDNLFEQSERTLHFVIYVPKPSHRPLRIAGNREATILSDAKGWLIPQWGGVVLHNLGYEDSESDESGNALSHLSAAELDSAFAAFEKQFSTLLGLQELQMNLAKDVKLALQLDAITRRRTVAASRETVKTLGSIIRLVDKIENLGVGQSVRDDISKALGLLEQAKLGTNTSSMDTSIAASDAILPLIPLQEVLRLTHSSELFSSRAFFNPNMLGQLYFPDEHKYAVYTPLFGPLAVPLLVAGLRLLKERRKTTAQKRALKTKKSI